MRRKPHIYSKLPANKRPVQRTVLHTWLQVRGQSRDSFARRVGCNGKTVDYWCDGQVIPSLVYAYRIEKVTGGGVPTESWLSCELAKFQWNEAERKSHES